MSKIRKLNCDFIIFSTSEVINVIDLKVQGISGVTLGGTDRSTMYVIAGSYLLNVLTGEITGEVKDGTSIYTINGLNTGGQKSTDLCLESEIKPMNISLNQC